jgi:hypothetical protein
MVAYHAVSEYDLLNLDAMESAPPSSGAEREAEEEEMRAIWYAEIDAMMAHRAALAPRHEMDTFDLFNEWEPPF